VASARLMLQSLLSLKLYVGQNLILLVLSFFLVILSLNVAPLESMKLTSAVIIQIIPGFYLWRIVNKGRAIPLSELIGMGLAIGTLLSIISASLLRTVPVGGFGWAAPFFLTMIAWFFTKPLPNITENPVKSNSNTPQIKSFLIVISILIYTQVYVWSRWHSLNPKGWWKYHLDVPYFEALSNSISLLGTSNSLMKPDLEIRYHWFAYGWVGSLNQSLDIEPFVVQTRLLPIVAMVMAATIAFSWAKDFTDNAWTAASASLLIVVGPGFAIGSLVMLRSPSSAMAAGWTLAFSLLFLRCLRALKVELHILLILCLLSIGVVAGKGINLLIIGSGVLVLLISDLLRKRTLRLKELQVYLVTLASLIASYFYLIHTPDGRTLKFGIYVGWPALMLTVLPLIVGIFLRSSRKAEEDLSLRLFSFVIFLLGALLSLVFSVPTGDQLYFAISAVTLCVVPSLVLIDKSFQSDETDSSQSIGTTIIKIISRKSSLIVILATGLAASGTWMYFENDPSLMGDIGRATAPALMWIFAMLGIFALFLKKTQHSQNFKLAFITLILAISITSSSIGIFSSLVRGPIYSSNEGYVGYGKSLRANLGSVSSNYFEAGEWVRQNTNLKEKFFTNRQCLDPKSRYDNCLDIWFFASALSERQYLIEGGSYNISELDYKIKMNEDQTVSLRFSLTPNLDDLDYLWSKGIRWGWIDKMVIERTDWLSFAETAYDNADITIIKLMNPKKFLAASS
jgi:hypothetical protein